MVRSTARVKLEIQLNADRCMGLLKPELDTLRGDIKQFSEQLLLDLGISFPFSFKLMKRKGLKKSFKITLNEKACGYPYTYDNQLIFDLDFLKLEIPKILILNREKLITTSISEVIRKELVKNQIQNNFPRLTRKEFQNYLQSFCRNYLSVGRGLNRIESWKEVFLLDNGEEIFEYVSKGISSLQLKLFLAEEKGTAKIKQNQRFEELSPLMQDGLFYELGVRIPKVVINRDVQIPEHHFCLQIHDVKLPLSKTIKENEFLAEISQDELKNFGIEGLPFVNPVNNRLLNLMVDSKGIKKKLEDKNYQTWDWMGSVILQISAFVKKNIWSFWNAELQAYELEALSSALPNVIRAGKEKLEPVLMVRVIKKLLEDRISIRNLSEILEVLITQKSITVESSKYIVFMPYQFNPIYSNDLLSASSPGNMADAVRVSMKKYISHLHSKGQNSLVVYLLDPDIEEKLLGKLLNEKEQEELILAIIDEISIFSDPLNLPCILTSVECRRSLQDLAREVIPDLTVLSYQELSPEIAIQPISRISLKG